MSAYRPLFHELSEDAYALAKGILEEALRKAQPCERYSRPSFASLFNQLLENSAGRMVCEAFGWKSATMYREPADRTMTLIAKLICGHSVRVQITDHVVAQERDADLLCSLGIRAQNARRCYCVERSAP